MKPLKFLSVIAVLLSATLLHAQRWSSVGGGMNDLSVNSFAFDSSGNMYAGGGFTQAGGVDCNRIAKWDGASWSPLGTGMSNGVQTCSVNTLAFDSTGNLYAGGWFTSAGGVFCANVAKWDGTVWSPLGDGISQEVFAVTFDKSGNLYVGGEDGIAKWDGKSWSSLGSGTSGYPAVYALAVDSSGNLYVGGAFQNAGDLPCSRIAKWNGTTWSALGSGIDGSVKTIAFDAAGNLYAGGVFGTAGGVACNYIAKWDGTSWSPLGDGVNSGDFITCAVNGIVFDPSGNLYAAGKFWNAGKIVCNNIARWDFALGLWSSTGGIDPKIGTDGTITAISSDGSQKLYIGGWFNNAGETSAKQVASYLHGPSSSHLVQFKSGTGGTLQGQTTQNITNGGNCTEVVAVPDADYKFTKWTKNGGDYSSSSTLNITNVTENMTFSAEFASDVPSYTVQFIAGSNGTISGTLVQTVSIGGSTTPVTAVPNTGYTFAKWTLAGVEYSAVETLQINNVISNMTFTAEFAAIHTVTFTALSDGVINGLSPQNIPDGGSTGIVVAVPDKGFSFLKWTLAGNDFSVDNPIVIGNVTTDMALIAKFTSEKGSYTVDFVAGAGGKLSDKTVSSQVVVAEKNCKPAKAEADSGKMFQAWRLEGSVYSANNPLAVKRVNGDMLLTAVFVDFSTTMPSASFYSQHSEASKSGATVSKDSFGMNAKVTIASDITDYTDATQVKLTIGKWTMSKTIGDDPKAKVGSDKGGSAKFIETSPDNKKTYVVTFKWDKNNILTVAAKVTPLPANTENAINLSNFANGDVAEIVNCEITMGKEVFLYKIPFGGKKSSKNDLTKWSVKGTVKIPKQ